MPFGRDRPPNATLRWLTVLVLLVGVGIAPGLETSLRWTGAATTLWMPVLTFIAAWTAWRPRTVTQFVGVLAGFVVVVVVLLTLGRLLVAGTSDAPVSAFFPALVAPGALLFVSCLQLTMVCERKPFDRWGRRGAVASLVLPAAVAVTGYQLVNWHALPTAARPAGLRDPGGPIASSSLITWLTVVAAWQVLVMVVWNGRPGRPLPSAAGRIAVNNAAVVGGATASYFVMQAVGIGGPMAAAIGGCVVAAGRLPFCLYVDGVDSHGGLWWRTGQAVGWFTIVFLVLLGIDTAVTFQQQPAPLWIAVAGLNLVSGGVTLAASFVGPLGLSTAAAQPAP